MNIADELQKLQQLHQSGAINDDEFASAKAKIINGPPEAQPGTAFSPDDDEMIAEMEEQQSRLWGMILHLSVLSGYTVVPFAGLVVPIVIWQLKKDELPGIDEHGRNAANWIISHLIYGVICAILTFVGIGFLLMIPLAIVAVVFPIVAALKANNGEIWKYPLSFRFFM